LKDIKAILFDLGNVIIRFDASILEKNYSTYGKIDEGKFVDYLLESENINRYMEGKITSNQFYEKTRRYFKMDVNFNEFYRIWNSMFYPYPEMEEIIRSIKKSYPDIKLVLISNTNEAHYDYIKEKYDILRSLDALVVSHELGRQKPHPDIFNEAMRLAGSIPKNTFYTDDRPELVEAARIMGIRAFQFTGHNLLRDQLAKCGVDV
jgi:putative hydrolase of the HAD superfamily